MKENQLKNGFLRDCKKWTIPLIKVELNNEFWRET